jgi:hypothetical protein
MGKATENVEKIQELTHEDHRQTIHELVDTTGISYGVCQEINRKFEHAPHWKLVLCILANDQKQWCVNMCLEL